MKDSSKNVWRTLIKCLLDCLKLASQSDHESWQLSSLDKMSDYEPSDTEEGPSDGQDKSKLVTLKCNGDERVWVKTYSFSVG